MTKTKESNQEGASTGVVLERIVVHDISNNMRDVVKNKPIVNSGSFAMTLLWQIFEEASEMFEEWAVINKMNDDDIEYIFKCCFPEFIKNYPKTMVLDA